MHNPYDQQSKDTVSVFVPEKQAQAAAFALYVAEAVIDYFKDEQHRKMFEHWYEQRYSKPYIWKRIGTDEPLLPVSLLADDL